MQRKHPESRSPRSQSASWGPRGPGRDCRSLWPWGARPPLKTGNALFSAHWTGSRVQSGCLGVICPPGSLLILKDIEVRTFSGAPSVGTVPGVPGGEGAGPLCPKGFGAELSPGLCMETEGSPSEGRRVRGGQPWHLHLCPGQAARLPRRAAPQRGARRSGFAYNYSDGIIFSETNCP